MPWSVRRYCDCWSGFHSSTERSRSATFSGDKQELLELLLPAPYGEVFASFIFWGGVLAQIPLGVYWLALLERAFRPRHRP